MTVKFQKIKLCDGKKFLRVNSLNEHATQGVELYEIPHGMPLSRFQEGDVVVCYLADVIPPAKDKILVLLFKQEDHGIDGYRVPEKDENRVMSIHQGVLTLKLQKLPRIAEILMKLSPYYAERHEVMKKTLDVLEMTQDMEALDALFSMRPEKLDILMGFKDAVVPIQIAEKLLELYQNGGDLEKPSHDDLQSFLRLAVMHGTPQKEVDAFLETYRSA